MDKDIRRTASQGASYKPESQRTEPEEWLPPELHGRAGLRAAIERGAILSKAPEPPAPEKDGRGMMRRFLDAQEVRQYDRDVKVTARILTTEKPDSVKRRDEMENER